MINWMYLLTLAASMMFTFMNHPLSMGVLLLLQTTLIAMITGMLTHSFWYSYILFMIMVGGMLVLFIYMTSVASNEKFNYSPNMTIAMMMTLAAMAMITMADPFPSYTMSANSDMLLTNLPQVSHQSLNKYINMKSSWIMVMMIVYLLLALIAVVKITNISHGPLRQSF